MRNPFIHLAVGTALLTVTLSAGAQAYRAPRSADGHADLNGIWQALNTANWDLEDHSPQSGTMWETGAIGAVPAGQSVVDGGEIPYLPAALQKKKDNFANRRTNDPEAKCYMPGIPRANYMPYPFQIVQGDKDILFVYEFASANRLVHMLKHTEAAVDSWMGWANGTWQGDTLVVENTGFNDGTWFDRAGNFHSDQLKVTERFTPAGQNLNYEATIEDPETFTRSWKISLPL